MAIIDLLTAAQGGAYFDNAAKACGADSATVKAMVSKFAPMIATRLKDKAAAEPEAFEALLDLLEEGGDLDDVDAVTGSEALEDGAAILAELYGSRAAANETLGVTSPESEKAAGLSATGVLAALAASNATHLSSDAAKVAAAGGGGILSIIIAAVLKGLLQGASRQLAPKRRRRRYTYSTRRRTTTRRRRTRTPGLDDVFREILGGRR